MVKIWQEFDEEVTKSRQNKGLWWPRCGQRCLESKTKASNDHIVIKGAWRIKNSKQGNDLFYHMYIYEGIFEMYWHSDEALSLSLSLSLIFCKHLYGRLVLDQLHCISCCSVCNMYKQCDEIMLNSLT